MELRRESLAALVEPPCILPPEKGLPPAPPPAPPRRASQVVGAGPAEDGGGAGEDRGVVTDCACRVMGLLAMGHRLFVPRLLAVRAHDPALFHRPRFCSQPCF